MGFFNGKNVLVYGMGTSGQSACKLLHSLGACVSMYDDDSRFSNYFCYEKEPLQKNYDIVVVSPGIQVLGNKIIEGFSKKKISIISELDLGYSFSKGRVIAITGTNGKTTVTSLLGEIFKKAGEQTFVCGNIGLPISSVALETSKKSVMICEVSNFQLELSSVFSPSIACVLNLKEDHTDRHRSFNEYVRVKNKITQNFKSKDVLVINEDDENVGLVERNGRVLTFSKKPSKRAVFVKNGKIYFNKKQVLSVEDIHLIGEKNLENVLACVSIAMTYGIKPKYIREVISSFIPPKHRLEFIGIVDGVEYYNDSKSTNVACVEMAVESLKKNNLILMLGGKNKNCDFSSFLKKGIDIKKIICFGECGAEIYKLAQLYNYDTCVYAHMLEATLYAKSVAQVGDCVLLSPGCASFDEFGSYAIRGQRFKEIIYEKEN